MPDYEYNSTPTKKDFDLLVKSLDDYHTRQFREDDFVAAMAIALIAAGKEEPRRTGRTTRIVDDMIQDLFNNPGKWVTIEDHNSIGSAQGHIRKIVLSRIQSEHCWLVSSELFEVDKFRMRLKMCPKKFEEVKKRLNG